MAPLSARGRNMQEDLTELLQRNAAGDAQARDALFQTLYPSLRHLAHARLHAHGSSSQLQTTALVHEVYLRMLGAVSRAEHRTQFMAYAATIMRSIITDAARMRLSQRRGGGAPHVAIEDDALAVADPDARDILRVHEALLALEAADPRAAQVVEMRYFAGYQETEIAELLGISERTVYRDWSKARAILEESLRD